MRLAAVESHFIVRENVLQPSGRRWMTNRLTKSMVARRLIE
jgi:hypothetical protein